MGGGVVAQSNGYLPCHRLPWSPPCFKLGFVEHASGKPENHLCFLK